MRIEKKENVSRESREAKIPIPLKHPTFIDSLGPLYSMWPHIAKDLLTSENNEANIAPFCTFTYLLFCKMGFLYHGVCTERIDRVFCECKLDNDLQ